jgi:(p)ppGpp synthase/HD superfamily hydrolase
MTEQLPALEEEPQFGLEQAVALATEAHKDQLDKGAGGPYVAHCLRVMNALAPYGEDYQIVAVLHDTIEDTWVTPEYLLEQGLDNDIVRDILAVTKQPGEPYHDLVRRAKLCPRSKLTKLADNLDNSDENRLKYFDAATAQRFRDKYQAAREILLEDDDWLAEKVPTIQASIATQNQPTDN